MSADRKERLPTNNTDRKIYETVYLETLKHNEALYPKGKSVASNESTKKLLRELKDQQSFLFGKLNAAKNVLQMHAMLYAFLETSLINEIPDNFKVMLEKNLLNIQMTFLDYVDDAPSVEVQKFDGKDSTAPYTKQPSTLSELLLSSTNSSAGFFAMPRVLKQIVSEYSKPEGLSDFLHHVAKGEQKQAQAMLDKDPTLLLHKAHVKDAAGRGFIGVGKEKKGITGLQYAAWAKDTHMVRMMVPYLRKADPSGAAWKAQLSEVRDKGLTYTYKKWTWVEDAKDTRYGGYRKIVTPTTKTDNAFSFQPLIDALTVYHQKLEEVIDANWANKDACYNTCYYQWQKVVGDAQRLLPAHVVNEYCQDGQVFWTDPPHTFKDENLVRSFKTDEGNWYSAEYNNGTIGEMFAVGGGGRSWAGWDGSLFEILESHRAPYAHCHRENIKSLSASRTQQLEELVSEILATPVASQQPPSESNRGCLVM